MKFSVKQLAPDADVLVVQLAKFKDVRGYFMESWSKSGFDGLGLVAEFVQDNESLSVKRGTVRGLHFQSAPWEQAKLVRVLRGAIYDVVVDIRPQSTRFGRWLGIKLDADDATQLFVPRGYAHGFATLTDDAVVSYKVDNPYARECEGGIQWNDPTLAIPWPVGPDFVISDKDAALPSFHELRAKLKPADQPALVEGPVGAAVR
jgi:dTDP-4-dehydrorhamnose 3,5-epimerase